MSSKFKMGVYILFGMLLLDFIPIKFAKKDEFSVVFVNQPKLGSGVEWATYDESDNNYTAGYIIDGMAPDRVLRKGDFDKTRLFLNQDSSINKFVIYYDEEPILLETEMWSTYRITAKDWDIIYPINRASFRKYYTSKSYLTVYDYNWFSLVKELISDTFS